MLAASVVLYACQKDLSPSAAANPSLSASTTNAATGEKVTLTVNNAPQGTHLVWASSSAAAASFSGNGQNSANVAFSAAGTYTITAYIVSGAGQDSLPYNDTSLYTPPGIHDSTVVPYPPADTTHYPADTTHYPVDTTHTNPHDTVPYPPADTTGNHDTVTYTPPPPPPYDSTYHHSYDSSAIDSIAHLNNQHVIKVVTIVITVH